jgi:DNA polymerase III delta prime subunit
MNVDDKQFLWVEKYRPKTIDECILPESLKETFKEFIKSGQVPHFLFSGTAGVGKTTIAKALCNEIGAEYLMINGSEEGRLIDTLRTSVRSFASTVSLTDSKKVVIIDEADYANPQSVQPALRGYMEEFSANCRFILTCNFKSKLIEPIHSRCTCIEFKIDSKDKQQIAASFFKRAATILKSENVEFDPKVVAELVTKHFPDYRRILNELQRYSVSGKIDAGILLSATDETFNPLLRMMKEKNFTEVRKWVGTNIDIDSTELFRRLYDKSVEYIEVTSIPQLVLILADYGYKNAFVTDQEINTMACLTEVMSSVKWR